MKEFKCHIFIYLRNSVQNETRGTMKQFNYAYLNGPHLLQTLTMPNNMSLTQGFEEKRDLLTQMDYKRGNTLVSQRVYTYDALGRPLTRQTSRNGQTVNDSFVHTYRSELASAQVNGQTYAYDYDNIGNRRMSIDASDYAFYDANELNQYNSIRKNEESAFVPTFDAAGNQTLVRTATDTWTVTYNAENRPVIFQKTTDSVTTRITCTYDYMGRRATKKVEEITTDAEGNETTTVISNHRFIYRGYLQIACCDLTRANHPCLWLITWDPTQPVATRPLAIQKDGTWYTYGWDLTKNICEIFGQNGYIRSTYAYTPFGSVTASGDVEQPIQWSSEHYDNELALIYYNYRHYNPTDGRWINRDPIAEQGGWNLYAFVGNGISDIDILGNAVMVIAIPITITITEVVTVTLIVAAGICLSNNKCRQTAKKVLLTPILVVIKAAKSVAKSGCKLRCKFANHSPHHSFKSYRIGTNSIVNCWKNHLQLNCWIKGKKTGFKSGTVRIPYGDCNRHKNGTPSGIWSKAITPYPFTINAR